MHAPIDMDPGRTGAAVEAVPPADADLPAHRDLGMPFPIWGWRGSHAIPDLAQIDEERWPDAFHSTSRRVWQLTADTARELGMDAHGRAFAIWLALEGAERDREAAARERLRVPLPLPGGDGDLPPARARRPQRQVCFRLPAAEHDRLAEAAGMLGLRPTQLARLLTLRGVGQVLAEAAGVSAAPPARTRP